MLGCNPLHRAAITRVMCPFCSENGGVNALTNRLSQNRFSEPIHEKQGALAYHASASHGAEVNDRTAVIPTEFRARGL